MEQSIKKLRRNLDESELLAEQEEFLKQSKQDPEFKLNVDKIYRSDQQQNLRAQEQKKREEEKKEEEDKSNLDGDLNNGVNNVFMPLQIIEHDTRKITTGRPFKKSTAIRAHKIDPNLMKQSLTSVSTESNLDKKKRVSLFARQHQSMKRIEHELADMQSSSLSVEDAEMTSDASNAAEHISETTSSATPFIDGSGLTADVTLAVKEVQSISQQNAKLVSSLSPQERQEALKELKLDSWDPSLLAFFKNRKSKPQEEEELTPFDGSHSPSKSILKENRSKPEMSERLLKKRVSFDENTMQKELLKEELVHRQAIERLQLEDRIREQQQQLKDDFSHLPITPEDVRQKQWLNMDQVEKEKLEWLRPIDDERPKKESANFQGLAARFKFNGDVIFEEENIQKGLHHHGDEQDRPGYTINELLNLCQSSFPAQKVIALQTLGNIFYRMHRGYFDICFEQSLAQSLLEKTDTLIIVRKCLDDNHDSVIPAAIKCLHGLVCNTLYDESSLDRIFCSVELGVELPKLDPNPGLVESDYKDDQLSRVDVIRGLLRIDTLQRLRYLLDFMLKERNDRMIVDNILDILIRVVRHSVTACRQLVATPFLIDSLIENFIPSHSSTQLNWKALKIIRILFTSGTEFFDSLLRSQPKLWDIFRTYLLLNPFDGQESKDSHQAKNVYAITIEILRLWRVLLISDRFPDAYEKFVEISCQLRNCFHIRLLVRNSFDHHYISNLFLCLVSVIKKAPELQLAFTSLVQEIVFTWIQEMKSFNDLPNLDGICALAAGIHYLNASSLPQTLLQQHVYTPLLEKSLLRKLTHDLKQHSAITQFKEMRNSIHRESSSLPSFGSIYFGGESVQLNQLLHEHSVLMLITPLLNIAAKAAVGSGGQQQFSLLSKLLLNPALLEYLDAVLQSAATLNWTIFELVEFNTVAQIALASRHLKPSPPKYLSLSFKIVSSIADLELRQSLFDFLFEPQHYLPLLDLDKSESITFNSHFKTAISFLNNIKETYHKFVSFEDYFWLFEPITRLLKQQFERNEPKLKEDEIIRHTTNCLLFIILVQQSCPDYISTIYDRKLFFSLISGVFLLNDGMFLHPELHSLLQSFMDFFVSQQLYVDSSEEKLPEPFVNFGNHFEKLCESYQTESYGDPLFNNYLFIFVQQKSNQAFRKKLLTDQSATLKFFILIESQLCMPLDWLLEPAEDNLQLIECYLRCLLAEELNPKRNSFYYRICCHHVGRALYGNQSKIFQKSDPDRFEMISVSVKKSRLQDLQHDLKPYFS